MKFKDLKKSLTSENPARAYIVTGDDSYVIKSAADIFKRQITLMPELNISIFSEAAETSDIVQACQILPMLDPYRLIFVNDFKGDPELLVKYLSNPNPSSVLVFIQPSIKENFSKIINKLTPVDCNRLDEENIIRFVNKKAAENSSSISFDAVNLLMRYCSNDLSRISSETEKLAALKFESVITAQDVSDLVTPDADYKIFEISEAVAEKNSKKAALVLKSFYEAKMEPSAILGLLYSHFRRLLYCSVNSGSPDLHTLLGVKEYAAKKSSEQAAKYSPLKLKKICDGFHNAEYGFKSGKINDTLALELFIMQILSDN